MDNSHIVKLESIRIQNLKNVEDGTISLLKKTQNKTVDESLNIVGVYGQNGSGKTAVVDAVKILCKLMRGDLLNSSVKNYIREGAGEMILTANFLIRDKDSDGDIESLAKYVVGIGYKEDRVVITRENLSASIHLGEYHRIMTPLFTYDAYAEGEFFGPKYRYGYYGNVKESKMLEKLVDLKIAKREADGFVSNAEDNFSDGNEKMEVSNSFRSFLFNEVAYKNFVEDHVGTGDYFGLVLRWLRVYASAKISIVEMNENFATMTDLPRFILPVDFYNQGIVRSVYYPINLEQENIVPEQFFTTIKYNVDMINEVLDSLVPGCAIGIYEEKDTLLKDGENGISFKLSSVRNKKRIPLQNESAGIKKIIALATKLVNYYNDPSFLLVIDEFDTGIFEYLLGEMIEVLSNGAKGQLIFTCHNLRAMEVLERESVVFTTTNEAKRYLRPRNISKNKNLRLTYLASLALGGQDEDLYYPTDREDFAFALEEALQYYEDME